MKMLLKGVLIFLLLFNAAGAFYGSLNFIADPTGTSLQISTDLLAGSPFCDYFLPGILLFLINGLLPLSAAIGLLINRPKMPLSLLPFWKNRHWAWSLALASGAGLVVWIGVQILMLGYWSDFPIQAIFGGLGIVILLLTLAPPVRKAYLLNNDF
jgi:hypothetical protein